jgi:hypothetical protein
MATIAKRTVDYWGLSRTDGIGRQNRSEHDFRPYDVWQVKVSSFTFSFTAIEQIDWKSPSVTRSFARSLQLNGNGKKKRKEPAEETGDSSRFIFDP